MDSEATKVDHADRKDLKKLIEEPRDVKLLADKKMRVNLGAGNVKKVSMKEIDEEFKASEGGQLLLKGGSLTVPVVDYIKEKYDMLSVETTARLEKELNFIHQDLISKGVTEEEVKRGINENEKSGKNQDVSTDDPKEVAKKAVKEKYAKYQKFQSEDAELKVKQVLKDLNLPGLVIRSVFKLDVWRKCSQLYLRVGITIPDIEKKDEYDLQMVFADGDTLNWILVEVKNSNSYPWESTVSPPNSSLFEGNKKNKKVGSWGQLAKSFTFISKLFPDIPFGKVFVFTAMPNMPRHVLEKELHPECMEMILCQEDLTDPNELRRRLKLDKIAPSTEISRKLLCIVASRLIGPASGLYVPVRAPADVRPNEEKQLKKEMKEVDKDTCIILDKAQKDAIEKAENDRKRIIVSEGPPGSGKTLLGLQILKTKISKAKGETGEDPMVIITLPCGFEEGTPLRQQLEANAQQGSQVVEWEKLLRENGIKRVRIEGRGKDFTYYDVPEELAARGPKPR